MRIVPCRDATAWNQLLAESGGGTIFHKHEWGRAMELLEGVRFRPMLIEDGDKQHLLPMYEQRQEVSWSVLGYGGPVPRGDYRMSFAQVVDASERAGVPSPTRIALASQVSDLFIDADHVPEWGTRATHVLTLPESATTLWGDVPGRVRTSVRYGPARGLVIRSLASEEVPSLHRLYVNHARANGHAYLLPLSLFAFLYNHLSAESLRVVGGFVQERLVAASVLLADDRALYWWLSFSDEEGRRLQASYPLLHFALVEAIKSGVRRLDMGSSHTQGVSFFKEAWGAQTEDLGWYRKPSR